MKTGALWLLWLPAIAAGKDSFRRKQLDYDRDTDYGRAQGTGVL
jgi:hypothetical protein